MSFDCANCASPITTGDWQYNEVSADQQALTVQANGTTIATNPTNLNFGSGLVLTETVDGNILITATGIAPMTGNLLANASQPYLTVTGGANRLIGGDATVNVAAMIGATTTTAGTAGVVPAPIAGSTFRLFAADGTYKELQSTDSSVAITNPTPGVINLSVAGGVITTATNGTSVEGASVVLGNGVGETDGQLLSAREIPQNGFDLSFSGNGRLIVPNSTPTAGILYKGTPTVNSRFLHNFGDQNTYLGVDSGNIANAGGAGVAAQNVAVGVRALNALTTGNINIAIGVNSLFNNTTGASNTSIGWSAMEATTTASSNTAIGVNALRSNISANNNTAIGGNAMNNSGAGNSGINNVAVGQASLKNNIATGDNNSGFGNFALFSSTTGLENTGVGAASGYGSSIAGFFPITTGTKNTFLGANTSFGSATQRTNATAIGANATVNADNTIVLGSVSGINAATATAAVVTGANTINTSAQLEVSSITKGFLPPRMTTGQRDAIVTPAAGLMVYNTTTNKLNFYNGTIWEAVTSA